MLDLHHVSVHLETYVTAEQLLTEDYDHITIATGVLPRTPRIARIDHPSVLNYIDFISGSHRVGDRVAIIGTGGIGFDVAELVTHRGVSGALAKQIFAREWGIDFDNHPRGGVAGVESSVVHADREVYLLQRKTSPVGRGLGKTTGWTHRIALAKCAVEMINAVEYLGIDEPWAAFIGRGSAAAIGGGYGNIVCRTGTASSVARPTKRRSGTYRCY